MRPRTTVDAGAGFAAFSDLIDGKPTLSGEFSFSAPHILDATTWKQEGSPDDKVPVTVDLEKAFEKLPPPSMISLSS